MADIFPIASHPRPILNHGSGYNQRKHSESPAARSLAAFVPAPRWNTLRNAPIVTPPANP